MAVIKSLDRYYQNFPEMTREKNFIPFWEKSIVEVKKIPIEPEVTRNKKKDTSRFEVHDVSYNGFLKTRLHGILYRSKSVEKSGVIIHIHDYNRTFDRNLIRHLDRSFSHFLITLRGHSPFDEKKPEDSQNEAPSSPGYMVENIIDLETYYVKSVYLDTLKSIDMLRLIKFLDCGRIGIYGKGLGAAAAFFTAAFSDRVAAIICDSPQFINIPMTQNISTGEITSEINDIVSIQKKRRDIIKSNLSYFDLINFSDRISCPAYFITGLNDTISPTECAMGLFNILNVDKTIEVYPEGDNSCGSGDQIEKSINWITGMLTAG